MAEDIIRKRKLFPTHIYDYNYKVSEGYYKPQTDFMETRSSRREREIPPEHQSYAERFAKNPWYGQARGLPYGDYEAALNEPLMKPSERHLRSSSLLREMKELEDEGIPLNIRANRRKKKFEEEEEQLGIRPRLNKICNDNLVDSRFLHSRIREKLRNVDDELSRSTQNAIITDPLKWNFELDYPVSKTSHRELPSGSSTLQTSYSYNSSKPPTGFFRSISNNEECYSGSGVLDFSSPHGSSRRPSVSDDNNPKIYTNRAAKLREERRIRESQELTDSVTKLVEKMRFKAVDSEAAYNLTKGSRASSIEGSHNDGRFRRRKGSLGSNFVYGVCRY